MKTVGMTAAVLLLLAGSASAAGPSCAVDAVASGTVCMDQYEASVWRVPDPTTLNANLVAKIQQGTATAADLAAGGATQLGTAGDDYAPCTDNGQNCANDIYAVSLPSVIPSAFATWFQAQEACTNSGKRLPTSAEWQVAANGTPDPGPDNGTTDCNTGDEAGTSALRATPTGARSSCVSARGAFDMVGNLAEWVADWVPASTACPGWGGFSDDAMCLSGASTTITAPGALLRGGAFRFGTQTGPLAVQEAAPGPTGLFNFGFRCARALPEPRRSVQRGAGLAALAALARVRSARERRKLDDRLLLSIPKEGAGAAENRDRERCCGRHRASDAQDA
jgi:hypothetical protein